MKQNEVTIGQLCWCRIGDERARVVVVQRVEREKRTRSFQTRVDVRFMVRRENESKVLPKARSASALTKVE